MLVQDGASLGYFRCRSDGDELLGRARKGKRYVCYLLIYILIASTVLQSLSSIGQGERARSQTSCDTHRHDDRQ